MMVGGGHRPHMVLLHFMRCGSLTLTISFSPVLVPLSAVFMLILETQVWSVSFHFVFTLFANFFFLTNLFGLQSIPDHKHHTPLWVEAWSLNTGPPGKSLHCFIGTEASTPHLHAFAHTVVPGKFLLPVPTKYSILNCLGCRVEGRSLRNSKHCGLDNVSDAAASPKWDGDN